MRSVSISARADSAYVDSSALVKLVVPEAETPALRQELRAFERLISSALARVEVVRGASRRGPEARARSLRMLAAMNLLTVDDDLLDAAARLEPQTLRSLDAVHLASALSIGDALVAVVTYDRRLADAARGVGLAVLSPA